MQMIVCVGSTLTTYDMTEFRRDTSHRYGYETDLKPPTWALQRNALTIVLLEYMVGLVIINDTSRPRIALNSYNF